jgi:putative peptidoglycan lipid II flippase
MSHSDSSNAADLKKSLSIATLIMTGSVLLSRIIGLVREMVLAACAGTSSSMDAYVASFLIPEVLNHVLAGGFLSITFIPIFQKYLVRKEPEKGWRAFSNLLTVGSVAMIVLIAISMFFARDLLNLLQKIKGSGAHGSAASPETIALSISLTRIILPAQLFFYWGAFLMAVQYAHKRFFWPAMMPLAYNIGIILGGLLLWKIAGIAGFAWGVLFGAFAGGVLLQLIGCWKLGVRFRPCFDLRDPDLKQYVVISLPFIVGMGMTFSNEIIFRVFGIMFSPGSLAGLNYALRVMMILVGVFGLAFASASYPFQSQLAAEGKTAELNKLSNAIIRRICILLIPLSAIMMILANEIIAILFQHRSFNASSTAATAPLLMLYLPGAFAFAANAIVLRNYYSQQNTLFPMIAGTAIVLVSLPLYWIFGKLIGVRGIPLASSISMIFQFIIMYALWSGKHENRDGFFSVIGAILKVAGISLAGAATCLILRHYAAALPCFFSSPLIKNLFVGLAAGLPSIALVFFLLDRTGIQPLRDTLRMISRR